MSTFLRQVAALVAVLIGRRLFGVSQTPEPVGPLIRTGVRHPWLAVGAIAVFATVVALVVAASGVIPIKASSGHWRVTELILDFAKVRSFTTHSLGIQSPRSLDDPALVLRGAGHYETGCASCHGRPGMAISPVMTAMTPDPPELPSLIPRWNAQQLFAIVKHGIKFTGMPAWPSAHRDDEVWAMVAFLRRMPTLDAARYSALVHGESPAIDEQAPRIVRDVCVRCHAVDGTGRGPGAFPGLAGQHSTYLHASLRAFAEKTRFSGIMNTIAANLDNDTMLGAAMYYERLPPRAGDPSLDPRAIERGASIAARGVPDRDIPSCSDCHGPGGSPRNPAYPVLAGQHARYLALQLELFQQRRRGGSRYANLMQVFVGRLRPDEIGDVSSYYGSLSTTLPR